MTKQSLSNDDCQSLKPVDDRADVTSISADT